MAKRFTDTEKWKKPFIRSLDAPYKLLWFYILDDCDHAGIWQVDFEVACIRTGQNVTEKIALEVFGDRIEVFSDGSKWFLKDFIPFQYGELSQKNRLHVAVESTMQKHGIGRYKAPIRGQGQEQGKGQGEGEGTRQGHIAKEQLKKEIFDDELYMVDLERNNKGKDLHKAFDECYRYHSQSPNVLEAWQWRQKLSTWLTIKDDKQKIYVNGKSSEGTPATTIIEPGKSFGTEKGFSRSRAE